MSLINNKKSLIYAVLSGVAVLTIFGFIIFNTSPKTEQKPAASPYEYVVAVNDLKKGDLIKEEDVEIKDLNVEITGAYHKKGDVIGRNTDTEIAAGKPVIKDFLEQIEVKETGKAEPRNGFRAVPVLIKKSSIPPYLSTNQLFDLFTKENLMKIENLKILSILDSTSGDSNKMLVLEIKNSDVAPFIEHQKETDGFIFVQKNPEEYGDYRFYDLGKKTQEKAQSYEMPTKLPDDAYLPPIADVMNGGAINNEPAVDYTNKKQVEIIVGNTKTKMEFEE